MPIDESEPRDPAPSVFEHDPLDEYTLLDCGDGEKLERFGDVIVRRPDPQAMWRPRRPAAEWEAAQLAFVRESDRGGRWETGKRAARPAPDEWTLSHRGATLRLRPTPFKHVGLFPEQSANWRFTAGRIAAAKAAGVERPALLNLFAYTGAATALAARAGAFVTHVDASKPALRWARENAELSELPGDAVRWIVDDAAAFVRREQRRGKRYAGILLDPPPYGRGPDNQKWEFETHVGGLLADCAALLDDGPAFVVLSCYAVGTSPLAFHNLLGDLFGAVDDAAAVAAPPGAAGATHLAAGELALPEEPALPRPPRLLPAGLCGRWWREA